MENKKSSKSLKDALLLKDFQLHPSNLLNILDLTFVPSSYIRAVKSLEKKTNLKNTQWCYVAATFAEIVRLCLYGCAPDIYNALK